MPTTAKSSRDEDFHSVALHFRRAHWRKAKEHYARAVWRQQSRKPGGPADTIEQLREENARLKKRIAELEALS